MNTIILNKKLEHFKRYLYCKTSIIQNKWKKPISDEINFNHKFGTWDHRALNNYKIVNIYWMYFTFFDLILTFYLQKYWYYFITKVCFFQTLLFTSSSSNISIFSEQESFLNSLLEKLLHILWQNIMQPETWTETKVLNFSK